MDEKYHRDRNCIINNDDFLGVLMTKIKCEQMNHYSWGDCCDGWKLIDLESISVIKEIMPADTFEVLHYHL